ncbi:MAG: peroxiredoxin [Cyanobacteria bacterium RYN_339]|nr:peroxiredoxin [Cyanobacteria bacterium RYN_339]
MILMTLLAAAGLVGQPAPTFTLPDDRGGEVKLLAYKGKQAVILAFFPKAFTSGCEKEMITFGKDKKKFDALGAQILGISYDDSKKQHEFAVHCAADFPFLSDDGKVAKLYGDEKAMVGFKYAGRRTVVIDKAGLVRFVYDGMPDNAKILADLKTLKK